MTPVEGIEPINGWTMMEDLYDHGHDRYPSMWYEAHHEDGRSVILQCSGTRFVPTQERFAWLLNHGTVQRKVKSSIGYNGEIGVPWDNDSIDAEIARASQA